MYKCWIVFDLDLDEVVAFWYDDCPPVEWAEKYKDTSRYSIECEWQGGSTIGLIPE